MADFAHPPIFFLSWLLLDFWSFLKFGFCGDFDGIIMMMTMMAMVRIVLFCKVLLPKIQWMSTLSVMESVSSVYQRFNFHLDFDLFCFFFFTQY